MLSRSQRKICRESIPGGREGPADTKGWWEQGREGMKSGGWGGVLGVGTCVLLLSLDFIISIMASLGILT